MKETKKPLLPLIGVMFFDHTSLNITFPILTFLFFDLHSNLFTPDTSHAIRSAWYGFCIAIPHFLNIFTAPSLSALSDVFGRKKILLLGTFGAFLFAFIGAAGILLGSLALLLLARFIQGLFSRTNPIAQAAIGDICTPGQKVVYMGYLQTAISVGAFVGPVIGGYVATRFFFSYLNYSVPYMVAALFGLVSFFLTKWYFSETLMLPETVNRKKSLAWSSIKKVMMQPDVIYISVILALTQISWSFYYQFMPPILKNGLQFDTHAIGWFVGLIALWLALATSLGIRGLNIFLGTYKMLVVSIFLMLLGLISSAIACFFPPTGLAKTVIWLSALPTAMGDVIAFSCITALYSNAVPQEDQGKVMGICFIVVAIVWSFTGFFGGILLGYKLLLPLLVAPIGCLLALISCRRKPGSLQGLS